jgi:hypothetical protein
VAHSSVSFEAPWECVFIFVWNEFFVGNNGCFFLHLAHTFYFLAFTIASENVCADSTDEIVSSPFPVIIWVAGVAMYN